MASNNEATATAGHMTLTHSNNEALSPIRTEATAIPAIGDNRADDQTPPEIRFLHECTDDNFLLGTRPFESYETPSANTDDRSPTDYGHATADSELKLQLLEKKKQDLLTKLNEQRIRKNIEILIEENNKLERQLEEEDKIIDLVESNLPSAMTSVTSVTTTSHASSSYNETPIGQQLAILDYNRLVTLTGPINAVQAIAFYKQSKQADFTLSWKQVIMSESLEYIRLRVATSYGQLKISKQEAREWDPEKLNCKQMADLVYQLYGSQQRTETTVQIENAINSFNFGFDLTNKQTEETSHTNLVKLISDHYGPLELIPADTQDHIAKLIYRKVPNYSELNKMFKDQTKIDIKTTNGLDTIRGCLGRYAEAIQQTRSIHDLAAAHAINGNRFFSGATIEKQSSTSSSNTTVSASTVASTNPSGLLAPHLQSRATMPHDTDFHERNRTLANRCETCGNIRHLRDQCLLHGNKHCNNSTTLWHFSAPGRAWFEKGYHLFTKGVDLPGYGIAEWTQMGPPPKGHVYPDEPNPTGERIYKTSQLTSIAAAFRNRNKHNHIANAPHTMNDGRNNRDNRNNNDNRNRNRSDNDNRYNNHNNGQYNDRHSNQDQNNDPKKARSESKQYVAALIKTITPKLLPVRLYLNTKGTTVPTAVVITTTEEIGAEATATTAATETPALITPGQGLPGPANTATDNTGARALTPTAANRRVARTEALLDSGSLAGNFINKTTLTQIKGSHMLRQADDDMLVCSGLDNTCLEMNVMLDITVEFKSDNITYTIDIPVRISDESPLGCIIGIDSIMKYDIVQLVPHFFLSEEAIKALRIRLGMVPNEDKKRKHEEIVSEDPHQDNPTDTSRSHRCATGCNGCTSVGVAKLPDIVEPVRIATSKAARVPKPKTVRSVRFDDTPLESSVEVINPLTTEPAPAQTSRPLAALIREVEQLSEVPDFGDEGIDHDMKDAFAPFRYNPTGDTDIIDKITISGTPEQQERIRALCVKYKQIFKDELDATPAKIKPFDLNVDKTLWETYKNRGPVRQQSNIKDEEIRKQVTEMEQAGIIERSQATFYSQVMLTPKPNGTWRFCVDYRGLNEATPSASWPIPNIANLLGRLGRAKADTFGVMDLTSGYHQAPITLSCRIFTAFITFAGVYQFTRLPFGPKRAPSYFQEQMATSVLFGLLYVICEMYLDDCIVYATGTDQFCERLEKLFIRFDEKHIFLKAIKCKLGMSEVEYVGKTISKEGLRMSDKQVKGVNDFPRPVNNTQLRSFLGFINYFRDHVPNHSNVVAPLTKMVDHSATKKTAIYWTPEGILAFDKVKQLIANSPKLYFIHDTAPIVLMTDASDYGIGGYLHQTVDGVQQLVALVSKAFTITQLKWSTIQKEAYAIFHCCTHLDRMLRDRFFLIETDHKNLMFLKHDSNAMVIRWWTAIQELDFDVKFIAGNTNNIADALSRLCTNLKDNAPKITVSALLPKIPITTEHYKAIADCHNSMVGHSGVERTVRKLKQRKLNWQNMRKDVITFIEQCPCCQKMSYIKVPINAIRYTTSTYKSMECVNIDFLGPFPDNGYLLVVICTFSRYVCIYPVKDATAKSASSGLLQHFGTFGSPKSIRSDNGSHFVNEVVKQFLEMVGTTHDRTMAYSSEENAIVERCNKEINRYIKAFMFDRSTHNNYQEIIPFVTRILNTNINDRTKVAPAQIIFGNAIDLDRGILIPFDETSLDKETMTTSSSRMLQQQKDLMKIAKENLLLADSIHNANIAMNLTEFAIDSYVLALPRTQPKTRLHPQWSGPYRVLENDAGKYKVKDLITDKDKWYHVTQLKQFQYDPTKTNPTDIARRDNQEHYVERIISMAGDKTKVSSLTFLVKWLGYDDIDNTYEPWNGMKDNIKLHEFLIEKNLRHLIPRKYLLSSSASATASSKALDDSEN